DVRDTLTDRTAFEAALEEGETVWWFVDALDEGRIKSEKAFDTLVKTLRSLQGKGRLRNLKLRLSCRCRDWRPTEQEKLQKFFPGDEDPSGPTGKLVAITLLPLNESAIRKLAQEKLNDGQQVDAFFAAMKHRSITPLAGQPLLLAMMLALFHEGSAVLGKDRTSLYEAAADRLINEKNELRREHDAFKTKHLERLEIAKQLAVQALFGGRDAIAIFDRDGYSASALDAGNIPVSKDHLLETLNTGMFVQGAEGNFHFIHRSIAEYLAACTLADRLKDLRLAKVLPLFPITQDMAPSPLRETAAWLAGFHAKFRAWLIKNDPITAAHGDTIRYTLAERELLIEELARRFTDRHWQDEFDRFGDLARSISPETLTRLLSEEKGFAVQCLAVNLIHSAEQSELYPKLMDLAESKHVQRDLRVHAVRIIISRAASEFASRLGALLTIPADEDLNDDIAGAVLSGLYPSHLTIAQVLDALHLPRRKSYLGTYWWFWNDQFANRAPEADHPAALDALAAFLKPDCNLLELRPFEKAYVQLLLKELSTPNPDVTCVGPWLVRLIEWDHHHGTTGAKLHQQLVTRLKEDSSLKSGLLKWRLDNWLSKQEFQIWRHLPYWESCLLNSDFEAWVDAFKCYSDREHLGKALFSQLVSMAYPPAHHARLEVIETLIAENSTYADQWETYRYEPFEGSIAQSNRRRKTDNENRKAEEVRFNDEVERSKAQLRSGNIEKLVWLLEATDISVSFSDLPFSEIRERLGIEVAEAFQEGVRHVWDNLLSTCPKWPVRNQFPRSSTLPGYGLEVCLQDGLDWSKCTANQVDWAIWIALHTESLPSWFNDLWNTHSKIVWDRLSELLIAEEKLPNSNVPWTWIALTGAPESLQAKLVDHVLASGLPLNHRARIHALQLALRSPTEHITRLASLESQIGWEESTSLSEQHESNSLVALAAWWLLDPKNANLFLEQKVLVGNRSNERAAGFVNSVHQLLDHTSLGDSSWPTNIPWDAYVALLPQLYTDPPESLSDDIVIGYRRLGAVDSFLEMRNALVTHIASGPATIARATFGPWRNDERFGNHRDWFAQIYAEARQREADESWTPAPPDELTSILDGKASLLRSDADLFTLLCDTIENDLTSMLRSDASLAPLLWSGTKKHGREPLDEKPLQTMVYGLLAALLRGRPLIGAREPEVFDAKKPDNRFSIPLDDGHIAHVPIEIKWAKHGEVWTAMDDQLIGKYMTASDDRFGVYIVGWAGTKWKAKEGPNGETPTTAEQLQVDLRKIAETKLKTKDKQIEVFVLDVSVVD
ncbi:MAG TPA: hypothetical protein VM532_03855, partial [Burkholderiales bacterium]|nr:hypothetical protein [Burkholderiales bacterium]